MAFLDLYQQILALELGEHCETYLQIPSVPANTRLDFVITPSYGYKAMVIHRFSYGDIRSGIFRVWAAHKGMVYHTGILTPDIISLGIGTWLYVTEYDRLEFSLKNIDTVNAHYFEAYLWHVNTDLARLEKIKRAVRAITGVEVPAIPIARAVPTLPIVPTLGGR